MELDRLRRTNAVGDRHLLCLFFSRCRSTDRTLPRYIRATTNHDGPGPKWVMERFGIEEDGHATAITVDVEDPKLRTITTMSRRFIPAGLSENSRLTGWLSRGLSPDEREAVLMGLWRQGKVRGA